VGAIEIEPLGPVLGAIAHVGDVRDLDAHDGDVLRAAVVDHQVLVVRGQPLTADELERFAARFGIPRASEPFNAIGETQPVRTFAVAPGQPPRADLWHTDLTFLATPPAFGLLHNLVAPELGGDTMWVSTVHAHDALSAPLQALCSTLTVEHWVGEGIQSYFTSRYSGETAVTVDATFPHIEQPLVIRHPVTGRCALYITRNFLWGILGLHPREASALLDVLYGTLDDPNIQFRWRWQPGDIAIWDQRSTNHRGLSDHYPKYPDRALQSVFVWDDVPVWSLAVAAEPVGLG